METKLREIEGNYVAPKGNIAIVVSRFNHFVVDNLVVGAKDALFRHGVAPSQVEIIKVPGAYEIPLTCEQVAKTNRFQGIIALGAIIRGSTPHFDYVASACASGVMQAQLKTGCPMMFGVLTTDTIEQAIERAGTKAGNKGADCAMGLLEMINVLGKING